MEKGVILEPGDHGPELLLLHCTCLSPHCAHCSLHQAMRTRHDDGDCSLDKLVIGVGTVDVDDDNLDALPHPQSMEIDVDGTPSMQVVAAAAAARKLKLPCRRNSRSFSSSPHENLSKSWPPLPLHTPSAGSVAYADARLDLRINKKLDPPMLTLTSSSYEHEQEIMSTHPPFEQQFTPHKKNTKPLTSPALVVPNPRRICRYCSREFPSGRALGGHMRVHGGLDVDKLPPMNHAPSSTGRSSSLVANSTPEDQFTQVNCMVSGSHLVSSTSGGGTVIRRRINSEESMVKGVDDAWKSVASRGSVVNGERITISDADEERLLRKREQLLRGLKEQSLIKKGINSSKGEISTPATQKSFSMDDDGLKDEHVDDDDEDDDDDLQSSKLVVLGNASQLTPLEKLISSASDRVVDDGTFLHKVRPPNPRPSRRRLWTDQEGTIVDNSANHHSSGRRMLSSPPPQPQPPPEHLPSKRPRPCSECGKVFWSWKALFGHMRCHPEREWRGIQRPDASSSELEKQVRASKRLSSLSLVAGNNELEETAAELESDAENREVFKPTNVAQEPELVEGGHVVEIEEGEGLENAEEYCSMKGSTRRTSTTTLLEESAKDDLTPSPWPTRKRSRRSRAHIGTSLKMTSGTTSAEPALTSETATSSELRDHEKVSTIEDLDMANCLVLLSSAGNKVQDLEKLYVESTQESISKKCRGGGSAALAPLDHSRYNNVVSCDDDAGGDEGANDDAESDKNEAENYVALSTRRPNAGGGMKYECSTCKRCFKSHQALGGHRASHRKTKGCFALMNQHAEETMQEGKEDNITEVNDFASSDLNQWQAAMGTLSVGPPQQDEEKALFSVSPSTIEHAPTVTTKKKKFKGHACSICHRIFPSGQALGGHKRCHWTGERITESGSMASSSNNNNNKALLEQGEWGDGSGGDCSASANQAKRVKEDGIDLNLPAPFDEEDEVGYDNAGLSSTEAIDAEVQKGVEDAGLDGEEINERHHVGDFIGAKRRSLNVLCGERIAEGGRRARHGNSVRTRPPLDWDLEVKCRSGNRAASSGMWNQQWTNAASSGGPPIPQVCTMQPL